MVKVGRFDYQKSTRPDKKLMVVVEKGGKKKTVHFGNRKGSANEHFKDRTGIWKSLDHGDTQRRKNFRDRMSGVKKKDGSRAVDDVFHLHITLYAYFGDAISVWYYGMLNKAHLWVLYNAFLEYN